MVKSDNGSEPSADAKAAVSGPTPRKILSVHKLSAREVLASLTELNLMGVCALDLDLNILLWNAGMEEFTGLKQEVALGESILEFFPMIKDSAQFPLLQSTFRGRPTMSRELAFQMPDTNMEGYYKVIRSPLRDESGKVTGALGLIEDVTEARSIRRIEAALKEAGEHLASSIQKETLVQVFPSILVPRFANWCAIFTKSAKKPLLVHVTHTDPEIEARLRSVLSVEGLSFDRVQFNLGKDPRVPVYLPEVSDSQLREICSDESIRAALTASNCRSLLLVPLLSADAKDPLGVILAGKCEGHFTDDEFALVRVLGNRMSIALANADLYEQATEAIHVRDDLMAIVSHDLRSPLGVIQMAGDLIREASDEIEGPARVAFKEYMDIIDRAVAQAQELVCSILDASCIQNKGLKVNLQQQPLKDVIEGAVQASALIAKKKSVTLKSSFGAEVPVAISMDRLRIQQALTNIIGNALKFTPEQGQVIVRIEAANSGVRISVEDTGAGIAKEQLPFIFERNWRAESGQVGWGLGLPIAKGIVEAHHGRIWAESTPGRGTTISLELPGSLQ